MGSPKKVLIKEILEPLFDIQFNEILVPKR